jgi:hypothetical protein
MDTLFDETIHIMLEDIVHLHGHQNKMLPLMKPFILRFLTITLNFVIISFVAQLMTFETIVSNIGSITTTSTT